MTGFSGAAPNRPAWLIFERMLAVSWSGLGVQLECLNAIMFGIKPQLPG